MFKKSIMMLIVVAIVATFSMIPASAFGEDSVFFAVDFDTQDVEDSTGNFAFEDMESSMDSTDLTYEMDDEIGKNVLVLEGDGVLVWRHPDAAAATLNGMDLATEGLTVEAYVWISDDAGQTNMVIIETCDSAVHLQEYNDGTDLCSGFRAGDGAGPQGVAASNAYIEATFPHGEWIHLVGTADGDSNDLYINGTHRASYTRGSSILANAHGSQGEGVYIGQSYLGDMWGATAFYGKIAYAKIYKETATAEDVATMYTELTGKEPEAGGDVVATTPMPTPDVTEAPADDAGAVTAAPNKPANQSNTQTFDLGLVSIAAVALSSVVAIKKRK